MRTTRARHHAHNILRLVAAAALMLAVATCGGPDSATPTSPTSLLAPATMQPVTIGGGSSEFGWAASATGTLASLSIDPSVFTGGEASRGTVTLHEAAPAGGLTVTLASDYEGVTVPASVTVAAGATQATFAVATKTVSEDVRIRVTASADGSSLTALMRITPEIYLAELTASPTVVLARGSATGTATLNAANTRGDTVVRLESEIDDARVPASITIAAGSKSGTFTIDARDVSKATEVWIHARINGRSQKQSVQIRIVPANAAAASTGTVTIGGVVE